MSQALINAVKKLAREVERNTEELAGLRDRVAELDKGMGDYQRKRGPKVRENGETQETI